MSSLSSSSSCLLVAPSIPSKRQIEDGDAEEISQQKLKPNIEDSLKLQLRSIYRKFIQPKFTFDEYLEMYDEDRLRFIEVTISVFSQFGKNVMFPLLLSTVRQRLNGNNFKSGLDTYDSTVIFKLYNILNVTQSPNQLSRNIIVRADKILNDYCMQIGFFDLNDQKYVQELIKFDDKHLTGALVILGYYKTSHIFENDNVELLNQLTLTIKNKTEDYIELASQAIDNNAIKCIDCLIEKIFHNTPKSTTFLAWCFSLKTFKIIPYIPVNLVTEDQVAKSIANVVQNSKNKSKDEKTTFIISCAKLLKKIKKSQTSSSSAKVGYI